MESANSIREEQENAKLYLSGAMGEKPHYRHTMIVRRKPMSISMTFLSGMVLRHRKPS
jgi:hypothetical protein